MEPGAGICRQSTGTLEGPEGAGDAGRRASFSVTLRIRISYFDTRQVGRGWPGLSSPKSWWHLQPAGRDHLRLLEPQREPRFWETQWGETPKLSGSRQDEGAGIEVLALQNHMIDQDLRLLDPKRGRELGGLGRLRKRGMKPGLLSPRKVGAKGRKSNS